MNQPRNPSNRSSRQPSRSRAHGTAPRATAAGRGFTGDAPRRARPAASSARSGGTRASRASASGSSRPARPAPARRGAARPAGRRAASRGGGDQVRRWLPVGAAGALLAIVVGVGMANGGDAGGVPPTVPGSIAQGAPVPPVAPVTTYDEQPIVTVATTSPVQKVALTRTIQPGMGGEDVERVQRRLAELGFDPGPVDGWYGSLSQQAVWAFDKLVMGTPRQQVTGQITPEMWDRMQDPIQVAPRSPTGGRGDHVEIYLPEQVMVVFHADRPALIAHISTGELQPGATGFTPWYETAATYRETVTIDTDENGNLLEEPIVKEVEGVSYTPPGVFTAYRMVEGRRQSALGGMYDPIYINQGIAIHGANNVPLHPASHGCIRVSRYLGERLQKDALIEIGDKVLIWDGVLEPHEQPPEARQMRWDRDVTTTTTSTTTTTTVPPSTTQAPAATTTQPATTTTEPAPTTTQAVTTTTEVAAEPEPTPDPVGTVADGTGA